MKNRKALNALWCVPLVAGCAANPENRGASLDVQPVYNVRHSNENPETLYHLGRYYQGQKRYDQALDAYERALQANPKFVEAHNGRGVILARQGKYDLAIAEFKAALTHAPEAAHVHNNLGYAYYLQGKYAEAATAMERAVALDPDSRRAHNNLGLAYAQIGDRALAHQELAKGAELVAEAPAAEIVEAAEISAPVAAAEPARPGAATAEPPQPAVQVAVVEPVGQQESVAAVADPLPAPPPSEVAPVAEAVAAAEPVEMLAIPKDKGVIRRAEADPIASAPKGDAKAALAESVAQPRDDFASGVMAAAWGGQPQLPRQHGQLNIEISNGNGVTGMARKVGGFLKQQGYPVRRITNDKPFSKPYTYVYYRDGYLGEALRLRADIPYTLVPIREDRLMKGIHVRVVLGKDMVQQVARFEGGKKSPSVVMAAAQPATVAKQGGRKAG